MKLDLMCSVGRKLRNKKLYGSNKQTKYYCTDLNNDHVINLY